MEFMKVREVPSMKRYSGLKESKKVLKEERVTDEELLTKVKSYDEETMNEFMMLFDDVETSDKIIKYKPKWFNPDIDEPEELRKITNSPKIVKIVNKWFKDKNLKIQVKKALGMSDEGMILWEI